MYARRTPELSILVVSYNTRAMTLACLDSIVAETKSTTYEIIVVDNASPDGSAKAISAHPSMPRLTASTLNHGFAGGNNIAAKQARGDLHPAAQPRYGRDGRRHRSADGLRTPHT